MISKLIGMLAVLSQLTLTVLLIIIATKVHDWMISIMVAIITLSSIGLWWIETVRMCKWRVVSNKLTHFLEFTKEQARIMHEMRGALTEGENGFVVDCARRLTILYDEMEQEAGRIVKEHVKLK
jgi:hypothetical protein